MMDTLYVSNLDKEENEWYSVIQCNKARIKMKLDTGAGTNVLPLRMYNKLVPKPTLVNSKTMLKAYGGHKVNHIGKCEMTCRHGELEERCDFYVVDTTSPPILGLNTCNKLGLVIKGVECVTKGVTKADLLSEYKDVCEGLGCFEEEYHIELKADAVPVREPPRKVPFALQERLKQKLEQMERQGVIEKVEKPTDWVSNLVIVDKKDLSIRVCLDPRDLNKGIKREHFQIPTLEDVTSRLTGKRVYTVIDLKEAFWQVPLSESSATLTTFNTPFGRYCFKRMPFGICSASEVLQKRVYQTFGDIPDVHIIADDMILASSSHEEADKLLRKVLQRAREKNIKFNLEKIQMKQDEVKYMGNIIGHNNVRPDEGKVRAIKEMPTPVCKQDVMRLIGMLNYLSPYIPDMSTVTAPMRTLLKKDILFQWCPEQEESFQKIKAIVCSTPGLKLYDPSEPVQIQCDSSKTGIGACLMQGGQPVAYYSRALTPTEQNWFPIEKECLAVVCAAERFQQYIYGREVEVRSDHKPLEMITKKSIHKASPRIQAMLLRLMKYNLYVKYQPGPTMYIADTLSRAYIPDDDTSKDTEIDVSLRVHTLTDLPVSEDRLQRIKQETLVDNTLVCLMQMVENGWPRYRKNCDPLIRQYWPFRDEVHMIEGVLFKGECIIIPTSMRSEVLSKLHNSHLGIEKSRARARTIMYWPSMSEEIGEMVAKCATCAKFRKENQREPLIPHDVPTLPWQKLGADIFDFGGKCYLAIVDYFSKYPEVCALPAKTAGTVIKQFKSVFARHGIPEVLVADNMPFNSQEMRQFAHEYGFVIKTSSPGFPQSNGQSERMIGTIKQLLRKAKEEDRDPNLALLAYRNTPVSGLPYSPAEMLMSRRLRDQLPISSELLKPKLASDAYNLLKTRQGRYKEYFDRGTKQLSKLYPGDSVRLKSGRIWTPAIVTGKHTAPRSYHVTTESGQSYRRNRKFLNKTLEPPPIILPPDIEEAVASSAATQVTRPMRNQAPAPIMAVPNPPVQAAVQDNPAIAVNPAMHTPPPRRSTRMTKQPSWMSDYVSK
jgi:transposase InsO family protein